MKQCPKCSFSCEDSDIICRNCGYLFSTDSTPGAGADETPAQSYGTYQAPITGEPYESEKNDGQAVASMVLGIIGIVLGCCGGVGLLASIPGLILGIVSLLRINRTGKRGKGFAIAGIVCSSVGLLIGGYMLFAMIVTFGTEEGRRAFREGFDSAFNQYYSQSGIQK